MIWRLFYKATLLLAALPVVFSCGKEDAGSGQQTVYFPEGTQIGANHVETIFTMDHLDAAIEIPSGTVLGEEIAEAVSVLEGISTNYSPYKIIIYGPSLQEDAESLVPKGNISVFFKPDIARLDKLSEGSVDLTPYEGYDMVAVSDRNDICLVQEFLEGDVLGSLNGLVRWANNYCSESRILEWGPSGTNDLPDATELFNATNMDETIKFSYVDKVVASVACSKEDKDSGEGTIEIHYSVTPLHAFDDQPGKGDYYYVHGTTLLNSKDMYHGRYTRQHGGVHARICSFYARKFCIESYISDSEGKVVGSFVSGGEPNPGTTIGSTTYSSGVSWSLNASLTGGQSGDKKLFNLSLSGGVKVSKTESRDVSDLNITLDQSDTKVRYAYDFNNCPEYKPIHITEPTSVSTTTATLYFAYIVHVPQVRDNSTEDFFINFKVTDLDYGSCRFYTTGADFKEFHWKINDTQQKQDISRILSKKVRPNRIPTGKLNIIHNDEKFGKYIYKVIARNVGTGDEYTYDKDQYAKGQTVSKIIPTGDYSITMETGDTKDKTKQVVTDRNVTIVRAGESQILTGANFIIKQ